MLLCAGTWDYEGISVTCLIAPTNSKYPTASDAVDVIHVLKDHFHWEIDLAPLEAKASTLTTSFSQLEEEERAKTTPNHFQMYG
jgi:predicted ATP-grasp superfamily ATP-dependent carboligase